MATSNIRFFTPYQWMVKKLNLSGNPLSIYAIIHGFSISGYVCRPTNKFISDLTGITDQTIRNTISKLIKDNLVLEGKHKYNSYKIVNTYYVRYTYSEEKNTIVELFSNWDHVTVLKQESKDIDPADYLIPSDELINLLNKRNLPPKYLDPPFKNFDPSTKNFEGDANIFGQEDQILLPNNISNNITNSKGNSKVDQIDSPEETTRLFEKTLNDFEQEMGRDLSSNEIKRLLHFYSIFGSESLSLALDLSCCAGNPSLDYAFGILTNENKN